MAWEKAIVEILYMYMITSIYAGTCMRRKDEKEKKEVRGAEDVEAGYTLTLRGRNAASERGENVVRVNTTCSV